VVTNGKLSTGDLMAVPSTVSGSGFLRRDAASQYGMLAYAFEKALGRPLNITEGYRSYERQVEYWNKYQAGTGNLAAYPGTSGHGWGISCDFGSGVASFGTPAKRWMDAHAPDYGWQPTGNTFGKPEPWHFDFARPRIITGPSIFDTTRNASVAVTLAPPKESEMDLVAIRLDAPSAKSDPDYASTAVVVGGRFIQTSRATEPRGAYEAMKAVAARHGGTVEELSVDRTGWNQYTLFEQHDGSNVDAAALTSAVIAGLGDQLIQGYDPGDLAAAVAGKVADTLAVRLRS
jgi:hypothetical protein